MNIHVEDLPSAFARSESPLHNRIWLLETHLEQAIQELRDAGNLMEQCNMPLLAKHFRQQADRKAVALGERDV